MSAAKSTTASHARSSDEHGTTVDFVAGVCSLLLPGLGYAVRGELTRAFAAGGAVLALFFGGMFIGGIDVVDRQEDRISFMGQALVGPVAFAVDYIHETQFKALDEETKTLRTVAPGETRVIENGVAVIRPAGPGDPPPPNMRSLARINEIGTLYGILAGMLNLILIFDAFLPRPKKAAAEEPAQTQTKAETEVEG